MLADLTPGYRYRHLPEAIALSICHDALHAVPRNAEPLKCIGAKVPRKRRLWRADNRGVVDSEQGMIALAAGT